MFAAVIPAPLLGINEPMVGANIHHDGCGIERREFRGHRPGGAVRERKEHDVVPRKVCRGGWREGAACDLGVSCKVRLMHRNALTRVRVRRQSAQLQIGVRQHQASQFAACITTCPGDRHCLRCPRWGFLRCSHSHNYTQGCTFTHSSAAREGRRWY